MDGIDGITAIKAIFITSSLSFLDLFLGFNGNILHYTILGTSLGFLFFNWNPAKIFLGDSGSIPLGFLIIYVLIDFAIKGYWLASIILPLYYILDTSLTLLIRIYKKKKFWKAHSEHFYQQAVRNGQTHKTVCFKIIFLSIGLFFFAFFSTLEKNNLMFLIFAIVWCMLFLLNFSKKPL